MAASRAGRMLRFTASSGAAMVQPAAFVCPPPPQRVGDGAHVHARLGAQADATRAVCLRFEQRDRRHLVGAKREVHESLGVVHGGAALREQRVVEFQDGQPAVVPQLHVAEHPAGQLHAADAEAVEDLAGEAAGVHACFRHAPADFERAGRNRSVPEAAGVGGDAEVQVRGDLLSSTARRARRSRRRPSPHRPRRRRRTSSRRRTSRCPGDGRC